MDFQNLVDARYSCRKLSDRKVDPALVDEIIRTASLAPTAVNKQPICVFRMDSPEAKAAVCQACSYTFGADTFLLVGCRREDGWVRSWDGRAFADVDGSIVATYMMLKITDLGLATTWVGCFDAPLLQKLCPALADYDLLALFPIGYPAPDAEPSPRHSQRKSPKEITQVL